MESFIFGHTTTHLPIPAYRFGPRTPNGVLILGGVHGDEIEGVWAAHGLLDKFSEKYEFPFSLTLVPAMNLDGVLAKDRRNARGVDLNRNLPTKDWSPVVATERYHPGLAAGSEAENQALMRFVETEKPKFIISLHSWKPLLNVNGDCTTEAQAIAELTGYTIEESIGYPTPGCLGTYTGLERGIPTITYEIERGLALAPILQTHVPAIMSGLKAHQKRSQ
jgi:murein peptide amidase A